jgi:hypothetical protein
MTHVMGSIYRGHLRDIVQEFADFLMVKTTQELKYFELLVDKLLISPLALGQ